MEESGFCSLDLVAYYLQKLHNCAHTDRKMHVLFLVHEPSLWDKQECVYDLFAADDMVETILVLLPSYNAIESVEHRPAGRYVDKTWTRRGTSFMTIILMYSILPMLLI